MNFTVGGDTCDLSADFCNANLEPGNTYYVKLVAANDQGGTTGTPYSTGHSTGKA